MNYKDVVNRIQESVEKHKMLVDFGYGQVSDIKTRAQGTEGEVNDADYPYLFLNPTQHVRTQQQITYNFNMIVMDMAREEEAHEYQNFLNIQSDCIQYIDDVVARLYYFYKDKPEVSMDLNYTPFYERFQDDLAGATATLSIVVPNSINECIAPFEPIPVPPVTGTLVLDTYTVGNETIQPDATQSPITFQNTILDTYNGMVNQPNIYYIGATGTWRFVMTGTGRRTSNLGGNFMDGLNLVVVLPSPEQSHEADVSNWPPTNQPVGQDFDFTLEWTSYQLSPANNFVAIQATDQPITEDPMLLLSGANLKAYFIPSEPAPLPVVTETTVLEFTQGATQQEVYKTNAAYNFESHTTDDTYLSQASYSNFTNNQFTSFEANLQFDGELLYQTLNGFDPANYQMAIYNSTSNQFLGMTDLPATDGVVSLTSSTFTFPAGYGNYYLSFYEIGTPNPQDNPPGVLKPLKFSNSTFKINVIS